MLNNASLHRTILLHIIEKGFAPNIVSLAEHFKTPSQTIIKALNELQEYHGVVLHPNEPRIWVIHPFSLAPTNFLVRSQKGEWWGNCAWCSLGVAALLKEDVSIITSLGAHGDRIEINIQNGEVQNKDLFIHFPIPMRKAWDNVIYTCSTMLVFKDSSQIKKWSIQHNIPVGDIQPIEKIWSFSQKWYGNHLNPRWKKWTVAQAKKMFEEFGLTHPIWQLDSRGERF